MRNNSYTSRVKSGNNKKSQQQAKARTIQQKTSSKKYTKRARPIAKDRNPNLNIVQAPDDNTSMQPPTNWKRPIISPITDSQGKLFDALSGDIPLVVCTGSAGVGKTIITAFKAAEAYLAGDIDKIIISRANVSTGKSNGFVPGTLEEKLQVWLIQLIDYLQKFLGRYGYRKAYDKGDIKFESIEHVRGRSFDNAFIIVTEAQQLTLEELKAITTRVGENSILVLEGDLAQKDTHNSGLQKLETLLKDYKVIDNGYAKVVNFTLDDIVRSGLCKAMVTMFHEARV